MHYGDNNNPLIVKTFDWAEIDIVAANPSVSLKRLASQLNVWSREWRMAPIEQQNHCCCWCGTRMCDEGGKSDSSTIEHIQPLSAGDKNYLSNFAVACAYCNYRRDSLPVRMFIKIALACRQAADLCAAAISS